MQEVVQSCFIGSKNDKLCYGDGFYAFVAGSHVSIVRGNAVFAAHDEFLDRQRSVCVSIWHGFVYDCTWQPAAAKNCSTTRHRACRK